MFCGNLVAQKVYGMCRNASLKVPGFPDFHGTLKALKDADNLVCPSYEVCVALPNGILVVKQCLLEMWQGRSDFAASVNELLAAHNKEFNPDNLVRGGAETSETPEASLPQDVPRKQLCVEGMMDLEDFESKFSERTGLRMFSSAVGAGFLI